jgi:agmatinase
VPTRAAAYTRRLRLREIHFETLADYRNWRQRGCRAVRQVLRRGEFLIWITGNHLGALPVYDELAASGGSWLVVQLDAHLDIHHFADCTPEPSHGNFLLHCTNPLPGLLNVGHRDLLLQPEYIARYYCGTIPASDLAVDPAASLNQVYTRCQASQKVFLDIDCDVFDPAFFPAAGQSVPFGLTPQQILRVIDAAWSDRVAGVAVSEFDPARDDMDRSLALLVWLLEHFLLRHSEAPATD